MGTKVEDGDRVEVEGQRIEKSTKHEKIYLVFNKPAGIVMHPGAGNFNNTIVNA